MFGDRDRWIFYHNMAFNSSLWGRVRVGNYLDAVLAPRPLLEYPSIGHDINVLMFVMASTIESFVFSLNALGWGLRDDGFLSVRTDAGRVFPEIVEKVWFRQTFPRVAEVFRTRKEATLRPIRDNHAVTKHRHHVLFSGEPSRTDLPPWMFACDPTVPTDPKKHLDDERGPREYVRVVDLVTGFASTMQEAEAAACDDIEARLAADA
ncbi:hypothetical protein [Gaopeijia maritima]